MAEKNPKTGKAWTFKEDRADDRKRGIKEGSARDEALDQRRGVPEEPGKGGGKRSVGKGQGGPGGPGAPGPMPPQTPPLAATPPPMPLPPGVRPPRPRARRRPMPMPGPAAPGPAVRAPLLPGAGGGSRKITTHSMTGRVSDGQRDRPGNARPGINAAGKKIGGAKKR